MTEENNLIEFEVGTQASSFTITKERFNKIESQFEFVHSSDTTTSVKVEKDEPTESIIDKIKNDLRKVLPISGEKESEEKLIDKMVDEEISPQIRNRIGEIFDNSENGDGTKDKIKTERVYKYSQGIPLAEEIQVGNERKFLQIINNEHILSSKIDLSESKKMILVPHSIVNSPPILPYIFENEDEIKKYIRLAQNETVDTLFEKSFSLWRSLIVTRKIYYLKFLALGTVYGYFPDKFPSTHYVAAMGTPGSGKGAILITNAMLDYRVLLAGNLSGANILDILGSIESCQVTIAEDELNDIENDPIKEKLYKLGISESGRTMRTVDGSTSDRSSKWYKAYSRKIFAGEEKKDSKTLEGFSDRIFYIPSMKSVSRYISEVILSELNKSPEQRNPIYNQIINRILHFRKLMLAYRLLHHGDIIEEVYANIDTRPKQLLDPVLQVFNSDKLTKSGKPALKKILPVLTIMLQEKGELSKKSLESKIYDAITELCKVTKEITIKTLDLDNNGEPEENDIIVYQMSRNDILLEVCEHIEGKPPENSKEQSYYSPDFGKVTYAKIYGICETRLFGDQIWITEPNRKGGIRGYQFQKDELERVKSIFETVTDIKILDKEQYLREQREKYSKEDAEDAKIWGDSKSSDDNYSLDNGENDKSEPSKEIVSSSVKPQLAITVTAQVSTGSTGFGLISPIKEENDNLQSSQENQTGIHEGNDKGLPVKDSNISYVGKNPQKPVLPVLNNDGKVSFIDNSSSIKINEGGLKSIPPSPEVIPPSLPSPILQSDASVMVPSLSISKVEDLLPPELLGPYATFDAEWEPFPTVYEDGYDRQRFLTFSILNDKGNIFSRDVTQFNDTEENPAEKQLLEWFIGKIKEYPNTFGYNTTGAKDEGGKGKDSDLMTLLYAVDYFNNDLGFHLPEIIGLHGRSPCIIGKDHIDLFRVFGSNTMKQIYKDYYTNSSLETVTEGLLGKVKYGGNSGANVHLLSPEERIKYNQADTRLTHELITYNNFETMKLMYAISKLVSLSFTTTCNGSPGIWWKNYLKTLGYENILPKGIKKQPYAGGKVLTAEIGMYRGISNEDLPIIEYDVSSMYPTQIINNNLSPGIVCCTCCENDESTQVSQEIMDIINEGLSHTGLPPRKESYWICQKQGKGIIPQILEGLFTLKQKYAEERNEVMEQAVKLLMNSLYGLLGAELSTFPYADYRIAELTTAFSRRTLMELKTIAEAHNFQVLYGDTDSLYMISKDENSSKENERKFLEKWNTLHPDITLKGKRHKILMLVDEKNYIKVKEDNTPIIKGLSGKKGDRPKSFNEIQKEIANNLSLENKGKLIELLSNECKNLAFGEFNESNTKDLEITTTLGDEPDSYGSNVAGKVIGTLQNKHKGETITFFKGDKSKPVATFDMISRKSYINWFKTTFEKQVKLLGIDFNKEIMGNEITHILETKKNGKRKKNGNHSLY